MVKITQKEAKALAAKYFSNYSSEKTVIITEDGQTFSKKNESYAKLHIKGKRLIMWELTNGTDAAAEKEAVEKAVSEKEAAEKAAVESVAKKQAAEKK